MFKQGVRGLSTKIQKTPEEIKAGLDKIARFRKFVQASAAPETVSIGVQSGKDLHIPKNLAEMAVLSGMPAEQAERVVDIAPRILKTLQSGRKFADQWQITWKPQERWSNPLMGWTGTSDPMSNVKLNFDSREEAIAFAERNGWKYEAKPQASKKVVEAGTHLYKHNFLDKRTLDQMKRDTAAGVKTTIWDAPTFGESHWFMPLKYHGDGVVIQHGPAHQK